MATSRKLGMIDTNVLVAAFDEASPNHTACRKLIEDVESGRTDGCVTPTVLFEFIAVITNSNRVRTSRSVTEAANLVEQIANALPIVHVPTDIHFHIANLYRTTPSLRGNQVFDLVIAATTIANGGGRIYTYNGKDFDGIPGLETVAP